MLAERRERRQAGDTLANDLLYGVERVRPNDPGVVPPYRLSNISPLPLYDEFGYCLLRALTIGKEVISLLGIRRHVLAGLQLLGEDLVQHSTARARAKPWHGAVP